MKILLSAYACEPTHSSEPSVGWNWAIELSKSQHDIYVLTRNSNKKSIDLFFRSNLKPINLNFLYFDFILLSRLKKKINFINFYYFLWQFGAFKYALKKHKVINFDLVHHITFVSMRFPSLMGELKIPFILGPLAGGETAPLNLQFSLGFKGFILELIRDLSSRLSIYNPLTLLSFYRANVIYVSSDSTKKLIPIIFKNKVKIQLAIGLYDGTFNHQYKPKRTKLFSILFVGRLVAWKGIHLALKAFSLFNKKYPNSVFNIVGSGPDENKFKIL